MMKKVWSIPLIVAGLVSCGEAETVDRSIVGERDESQVVQASELTYSKSNLLGRWQANWMNDPAGKGSTTIYEFNEDGVVNTYFPGKSTSQGTWDIVEKVGENVLTIESPGPPNLPKATTITWCRLEAIDKDNFDVKAWYVGDVVASSNHIRFSRIRKK